MNYHDWDDFDLLEALEMGGRSPDPALVGACLDRGDALTPGLLDMLARGTQPHWKPDDPRWFRDAHAGLLLIAQREAAAIPVFDRIFRDPVREKLVAEWFEIWLPEYGPDVVPMLARIAADADVYPGGRATAIRLLGVVGELHPEEHARILPALRALLPTLRDDGTPDVDDPTPDDVERWTWVASSLQALRDAAPRAAVAALFEAGLVDEDVLGDVGEYMDELAAPPPRPSAPPHDRDVRAYYVQLNEWQELSDEELVDSLHQTLLEAGIAPEAAAYLKNDLLAVLDEHLAEEDDAGFAVLERLSAQLRAAGVPDDQLGDTLDQLMLAPFATPFDLVADDETDDAFEEVEDGFGDADADADAAGAFEVVTSEDDARLDDVVEAALSRGVSEKKIRRLKNEMPDMLEHIDPASLQAVEPDGPSGGEASPAGRDDRVTVVDPDTGRAETLPYEHARRKLGEGWKLRDG